MSSLPVIPSHTCPFCGGAYTMQCRCKRGDMTCGNGHEWHHKGKEIHAGPSDHGNVECCSGPVIAICGPDPQVRTASTRPSHADMQDAIEHADSMGDQGWTVADFDLKFLGNLHVKDLEQYDDLSAWMDFNPGDFKDQPVEDRVEELRSFRGPQWFERAKHWIKEGIPPIIVITAPNPDDEDYREHTQIGDGRGRVNFAAVMGMKLPVWEMTYKGRARTAARVSQKKLSLEKLQARLKRDLRSSDPDRFLTALAVGLIQHTGETDPTAWRKTQVRTRRDGMFIKVDGKRGQSRMVPVTDPDLRTALTQAVDAADEGLFAYDKNTVTATQIEAYLKKLDLDMKAIRPRKKLAAVIVERYLGGL